MELITLKNELKELSIEIKNIKISLKKQQKEACYGQSFYKLEIEKKKLKSLFRHKHIAYCLLKGRVYEQIEKPSENNPPNWTIIKGVLDAYRAS
jgi:hypothetical protein